jgi:hypothetical protein
MKIIVSALAIVLSCTVILPCHSQVNGVDLNAAIPFTSLSDDDLFPWEQLIDSEDGIYFINFEQTPEGYKHCLEKAKTILSENGKDFSKDRTVDNVIIPSNIEGLTDYQHMPEELRMSKAEIALGWELTDEFQLRLLCNDEIYTVYLIPAGMVQDC